MAKHRFRRLRPDYAEARGLKLWYKALTLKHLSVKTANNKGFKYSQLESWLLFHHLAKENKIKRLLLCLLSLDNNLSNNDSEKVFGPTVPDNNSSFLCQ